jgi:DNA-binding NarL/FixJ family response regulator
MIRIAIAEDHKLVINGLQKFFETSPEIEIIGTYLNGEQLLEGLQQQQPDILLLDIQMPGKSGIELAGIVHKKYPAIKMIALTNIEILYQVKKMMRQGCMGYMLKDVDAETLFSAIHRVYNGEQVIHDKIRSQINNSFFSNKSNQQITQREIEIIQLIAGEFTTNEIADKLFLSPHTIENHRNRILLKLDVKNTAGMVKKAMENGWI